MSMFCEIFGAHTKNFGNITKKWKRIVCDNGKKLKGRV